MKAGKMILGRVSALVVAVLLSMTVIQSTADAQVRRPQATATDRPARIGARQGGRIERGQRAGEVRRDQRVGGRVLERLDLRLRTRIDANYDGGIARDRVTSGTLDDRSRGRAEDRARRRR